MVLLSCFRKKCAINVWKTITAVQHNTGFQHPPINGFHKPPQISYNHEEKFCRYPKVSSCEMRLKLAVDKRDSAQFKAFVNDFIDGIINSTPYGRV